jgi:hypothetical protein
MKMPLRRSSVARAGAALLFVFAFISCNHHLGSKLTLANYNQITDGMSKAQVQEILGPPTSTETKNMILFEKTTYRWEDGKKFAMVTFKNDQVDSKESNLATQ